MNDFLEQSSEDIIEEPSGETTADLVAAKSKKKDKEDEEGTLTVDVYRTGDDVVIKSTIAGVSADELDITINNDMVTIRGSRQPDEKIKESDYDWQELYWGPFSRTVILPEEINVDKAKASIKNGILTIKMPKAKK
ncbi:MAG: Hsp20/alpha crystallin family protein [bacterium]|nr:Hsp20/alpha crystallin family protein [bacterium]